MKNDNEKEIPYLDILFGLLVPLGFTICAFWPISATYIPILIRRASFLPGFCAVYSMSSLFLLLVLSVTTFLDQKYKWEKKFIKRMVLQLIFGVFIAATITILSTWIFFHYLNLDIMVLYSRHLIPLIFCFTFGLNLYLLCIYYIVLYKEDKAVNILQKEPTYPDYLLITYGLGTHKIPMNNIAYFYSDGKERILKTHAGTSHVIQKSLDKLEEILNPSDFYRVSRTYLVNRMAILQLERQADRGLLLLLVPETREPVKISRIKASLVMAWLENSPENQQVLV
jgi:hypothetical protein